MDKSKMQQESPDIIVVCGRCDFGARAIAAELSKHMPIVLVEDIYSLGGNSPCVQVVEIKSTLEGRLDDFVSISPATYEDMAFRNREPKNYDKFLPKPIGKQRRRK